MACVHAKSCAWAKLRVAFFSASRFRGSQGGCLNPSRVLPRKTCLNNKKLRESQKQTRANGQKICFKKLIEKCASQLLVT